MMALLLALSIGILAGSGVWLLLRPRTYQVIIGLSLCSYAVNLFIFSNRFSCQNTAVRISIIFISTSSFDNLRKPITLFDAVNSWTLESTF